MSGGAGASYGRRREQLIMPNCRRGLLVLTLLAASSRPVFATILEAGNGILTIRASDDADSIGLFTVGSSTAIAPPDGQNIFFDFKNGIVNTSYVTIRDDTHQIMWVNADPGLPPTDPSLPGYSIALIDTIPAITKTISPLGASGFLTTYTLPGMTVVDEVAVVGSALADSAVRQTIRISNTSGAPLDLGVRLLWDWMVDANDAAYFRPRDTDGLWTQTFTGFSAPIPFERYQMTNSPLTQDFSIYGTVAAASLAIPPDPPDLLAYAGWGQAHLSAWTFSITGGGVDSAIIYYWGEPAPITVAPGGIVSFTQYVSTRIDALRSPHLVLDYGVSNSGYVCGGDSLTYTIGIHNDGDATANNVLITDSLPNALEYLPGSMTLWTPPDSLGTPAISSSAWANSVAGPWTPGEPPIGAVLGSTYQMRWVLDRLAPGQSAVLQFTGNIAAGQPYSVPLSSAMGATELYDGRSYRSKEVHSTNARVLLDINAVDLTNPGAGQVIDQDTVRYTLFVQTACQTSAYNLRIFDTVPPGMTLSVGYGATVTGGTMLLWALPVLRPGESASMMYDAVVSCATVFIHNTAAIDYDGRKNGAVLPEDRQFSNDAEVDPVCPQLYFRKLVPSGKLHSPRGGTVSFALDVINQFNTTMTNIRIWDSLPAGMTFLSADSGGVLSGNRVDWTGLPDLGPGGNFHVDLAVTISATCSDPDVNFAQMIFTPDPKLPPPPRTTNDIQIVLDNPRIVLSPVFPQAPVIPLDTFQYEIIIGAEPDGYGHGWENPVNITVWDSVPVDSTLLGTSQAPNVSATVTGSSPQIVTWSITLLGAGDTSYVFMNLRSKISQGSICADKPWGTYTDPAGCIVYSTSSEGGCVDLARPGMSLMKYIQNPFVPVGGTARFAFTMTNTGNDSAINLVLDDPITLFPNVAITSCSGPAGWTCTLAGTDLMWTYSAVGGAALGAGREATLRFDAMVLSGTLEDCGTGPSQGNNVASMTYQNRAGDPMAPVVWSNTVCLRSADAVLDLVKSANALPLPSVDGRMWYYLTVSNTGGVAAQQITVWDSLPVGATFVACTGGASCGWSGGTPGLVSWSVADRDPGASEQLGVLVLTTGTFSCTNYAEADYTNTVPAARPRVLSNGICLPVLQAKLDVSAFMSKLQYAAGESVTIYLTFTNVGDGIHGVCEAQKVTIKDHVATGSLNPQGYFFKNSQPSVTITGSPQYVPDTYEQVDLGSLAAGDGGHGVISVVPPIPACSGLPTISTHTIEVSYNNAGSVVQPIQTFYFSTTIYSAGMSFTLTPSAWVVPQGGLLTYRLDYANICSDTVSNVRIWDTVPSGVAFSATLVVFSIGTVPPGTTGSISFTVTVTGTGPLIGPDLAYLSFRNSAGFDQPRMTSLPVTVQVIAPHLTLNKTGPPTANTSDAVTFTLTLRNAVANSDTAYNVTIVDVLPPPLHYAGGTGSPAVSGSTVTWTKTMLGIGDTWVVTVDARAPDSQGDYTVTNSAAANYRTLLGSVGAPAVSPSVTVRLAATLVFRAFPNPFEPGTAHHGTMKFTGLPVGSIVHVYTLAGADVRDLADPIQHTIEWDGRNHDGSLVAAGIYLYAVEIPDGKGGVTWHKNKFGIIR